MGITTKNSPDLCPLTIFICGYKNFSANNTDGLGDSPYAPAETSSYTVWTRQVDCSRSGTASSPRARLSHEKSWTTTKNQSGSKNGGIPCDDADCAERPHRTVSRFARTSLRTRRPDDSSPVLFALYDKHGEPNGSLLMPSFILHLPTSYTVPSEPHGSSLPRRKRGLRALRKR